MQISLFQEPADSTPVVSGTANRQLLEDGAWIEYHPRWFANDQALLARLLVETDWHHERRQMYERVVDVPRLMAPAPLTGKSGGLIREMETRLERTYESDLSKASLVYYRDGEDSVAPHGDRIGARQHDAVIAIVSLGAPRKFTLRQVRGRHSFSMQLGNGDLLVMGGSCQRTWLHGVPKVRYAEPRISIVFRPAAAEPEQRDFKERKVVRYA